MQQPPRRIILVKWKKLDDLIEVYSSLKDFCNYHPHFSYDTLNNYLSKKKVPYENGEIKVERKGFIKEARKPELRNSLFWEFDLDRMDWMRSYRTVIERVIELGRNEEIKNMINFYSAPKVLHALKEEIPYLTDAGAERACQYFHLSPNELKCYTKKQSQPTYWI
jgi:hypothetical protein